MRSIPLLYRILLPPLILFRFCLPRPSKTLSGLQVMGADVQLLQRDAHVHDHLRMMLRNRNEENDILQVEKSVLKKTRKSSRMLKKTQPSINDPNSFKSRDDNVFRQERDRSETVFRTGLNLVNQRIRFLGELHKLRDHSSSVTFKENGTKETIKSEDQKANISQSRNMINGKARLSQYSTKGQDYRAPSRVRKTRAVNKQLLSPRLKPASSRAAPPEYMVHLFDLLSGARYESLRNLVVTGYVNINKNKDSTNASHQLTSSTYKLNFDVIIPQETETIHFAELRLFVAHKSRNSTAQYTNENADQCHGLTFTITIWEMPQNQNLEKRQIFAQTITKSGNYWLNFNVTAAVKNWSTSGMRVLEITPKICKNSTNCDNQYNESNHNNSDCLLLNLDSDKSPLLVIFSKKHDIPIHIPHERNVRDTIKRTKEKNSNKNVQHKKYDINGENYIISNDSYFHELVELISTINSDYFSNHESENIAGIGRTLFHSNAGYLQNNTENENEQLLSNIYTNAFLNADDNIQSTTNNLNWYQLPRRKSHETSKTIRNSQHQVSQYRTSMKEQHSKTYVEKNVKLSDDLNRMKVRRKAKLRYRRHLESLLKIDLSTAVSRLKRSKKKRVSCQRKEMYVDFQSIKWDSVIIAPLGYQAFECTGKCYTPIGEYLTPTKHAIIQTLVHASYPEQASRACCVPTKFDPISIIYFDENGSIRYDYTSEDMVVAECGCR